MPENTPCDICGESFAEREMKVCRRCGALCCQECYDDHTCEDALEEGGI